VRAGSLTLGYGRARSALELQLEAHSLVRATEELPMVVVPLSRFASRGRLPRSSDGLARARAPNDIVVAGDPAAVDLSAAGAGGFACPVSTGGAAGSASVVWAAAALAGGASLGFSTRVELCEKPSAARISGARATSAGLVAMRDVIATCQRSAAAAKVLNL